MKNAAQEVKLVHHRTRIALPEVEMRNRTKRAQVLSPHPVADPGKLIHKSDAPLDRRSKV